MINTLLQGPDKYEYFLSQCWPEFIQTSKTCNSDNYRVHKKFLDRQNTIELPKGKTISYEQEAKKLGGNAYIDVIKQEKANILKYVEDVIAAEAKAKADAEEREKIVKGLDREYFENLLNTNNTELFIIKLCSLFDAKLRFDYHFDGEDFSARMNQYFAKMRSEAPKSRTVDDGWGYMVKDEAYEKDVVVPAQERIDRLSNVFNILRMQRNNIAHAEAKNVPELSIGALKECLDHVFSI